MISARERAERALAAARAMREHHWLISLDEDQVRRQADHSTRRWRAGRALSPLDGVPVAIKDQFDVAGEVTTCGTRCWQRRATHDAVAVARLREAGAILFGKANLHELALGPTGRNPHHGDASNPWDPCRDTGGSSSGCAALVAAGIVPLALGSDLGGSLRIPASLCGVAALKPGYGRVSTDGLTPIAPSLEHAGPIGSSIAWLRLAFAVLAGDRETAVPSSATRVGICDPWWVRAQPESARVAMTAVRRLEARVVSIELPALERAVSLGGILIAVEAADTLAWAREQRASLGAAVRLPLAFGRAVPSRVRAQARQARASLCHELAVAFEHVDVIATPTTDTTAPRYREDGALGELDERLVARRIAFTIPFNLTRLPAVQVPCGFDSRGLPVGLQLAGPRGSEARLLALAGAIESAAEQRVPRLTVS